MKFLLSNSSTTTLMADFQVDGGFDFHEALIDPQKGKYQFIWEAELDTSDPIELVTNYRAAIDDIEIAKMTCKRLRKFYKVK